jgi:hypothetical protein
MRRSRLTAVALVASLLAVPLLVDIASAHDVAGSRFDAPLPLPVLFAGAGVTVAATAGWLARTDRKSVAGTPFTLSLPDSTYSAARWTLRAVGVLGFATVLWFGLFGPRIAADNPATLFAWPVAVKGVAMVAVLVGTPWRALSPWRTVYEGLVALEGDDVGVTDYPSWLGIWPAVVGFLLLVGVAENLTEIPQSPRLTAGVLAVYALVMLVGGLAFGRAFFERADPLEVFYELLGRVAPFEWRDGDVVACAPWAGCARRVREPGVAAFVVAAVYTVTFDGFANTPEYQTLHFVALDLVGVYADVALYVVGFAGFLVVYFAVATAVEGASSRVASRLDARGAAADFAPTVVPIAAAYEVAHNYPYVARNLSRLLSMAGDATVALLGWLPLPAFWGTQVVLVVAGHVVAVAAAHRVAVTRYGDDALRAHLPLVALMVGYTVLSLWIVSRPVVA